MKTVVETLEARYKAAKTLRVSFLERYREGGKEVRAESGKAYFRRPGKMRWEYESPEVKLFLSDGKRVWFYVPADRTVLRSGVKESSDWRTPFVLLVRNPRLSDICKSVTLGQADEATAPGHVVLHCLPRGTGADSHDEIVFELNASTGDLSRVLIREAGGLEIEFRFADWERNPIIPQALFEFRPPVGTAIVDADPGR